MDFLYSNILPLGVSDGQKTIIDCFNEQISIANKVEIAVGYVSRASLEEIESLVDRFNLSNICIIIGMYYFDGMPESSYHTALRINSKWKERNIGEIRIIKTFKYHGKAYCFYNNQPVSAIVGSANLGIIKSEASNRRQYELGVFIDDADKCKELSDFISKLKAPASSMCIDEATNMPLIREENTSLSNIENVTRVPNTQVDLYYNHKTDISFELPIKVPAYDERFLDDKKHYIKSNLNVCYAAPRNERKSRDWFETQLTVSKKVREETPGYPEYKVPFFVITDDGYWFKAHTTSQGNKQFSAVGDELILGRWIKGRLAAAGLVMPVNNTQADIEHKGMITKEMLEEYGCNNLVLTKTDMKSLDENSKELDVWILSFESIEETK